MSDLIFVINNELQSVAPPSIKDFCMTSPRGAYTTLQISKDFLAIDFDLHIERLIKSIAAVHAKLDSCYANYYTALDAQVILLLFLPYNACIHLTNSIRLTLRHHIFTYNTGFPSRLRFRGRVSSSSLASFPPLSSH